MYHVDKKTIGALLGLDCKYCNDTTRNTHVKYLMLGINYEFNNISVPYVLLCTQTGKAVKAKWKNLINYFRTLLNKEKSGSGGTSIVEKNKLWAFYNKMSFLRRYVTNRA